MPFPQRHLGSNSDVRCSKRRIFIVFVTLIVISNICTFILLKQSWHHASKCEIHFSNQQEAETVRQWQEECPQIGGGPRGVVLTVVPGGRLGNHVFEYLSVWSMARRYNVWPAVPKLVLQTLNEGAFTKFVIPSLEDLTNRCNLSYLLEDMKNIGDAGNVDDLFEAMKFENNKRVSIIVLRMYIIGTEYIVPYWIELSEKMVFQDTYLLSSERELHKLTEDMKGRTKDNGSEGFTSTSDIQYVAVHVRRTDYMNYLKYKFGSGTQPATAEFFHHAMEEMRRRLKPRDIIFVVVSDDPQWCRQNLHGPDVIIAGNGDISSPGHDLALLSACNHTIMAYGTFGLTAAMHNKNGITIIFNTKAENGTAAMGFARRLPNWMIL